MNLVWAYRIQSTARSFFEKNIFIFIWKFTFNLKTISKFIFQMIRVLGYYANNTILTVFYLLSTSFPAKKRSKKRIMNITYEHDV